MPDLNTISLLPPEFKLQRHARRRKALMLFAGAAMLALFILLNLAFALTLLGVEREIAQVEQQRALVQQEINKLQDYTAIQEQVNTVERILDEALGKEPLWHELLLSLGLDFPTGMRLSDISASYTEDRKVLFLNGSAPNHNMALAWVEQLEGMPQLGEVEYEIFLDKGPGGLKGIDFSIMAVLHPGEPAGGRKGIFGP